MNTLPTVGVFDTSFNIYIVHLPFSYIHSNLSDDGVLISQKHVI